jgi:hypothetical protein
MKAEILSVDHSPKELDDAVPFSAELIRELPGPDRSDYWLARLAQPLSFSHKGHSYTVKWVVLAARYVGQSIRPRVGRIVIGLALVLDDSQVDLPALDMEKCLYAAIGEANII